VERSPRFIKTTELAEIAGVGIEVIYRLIDSHELAAIKVGRHYRIPREAAEALLGDPATGRPARVDSPETSSGTTPLTKSAILTSLIEHLEGRVEAKCKQLLDRLNHAQLSGRTEMDVDDLRIDAEYAELKARLAEHRAELVRRGEPKALAREKETNCCCE
jgi:excisionase family DNA binding protein